MLEPDLVVSQRRPVESRSIVAISLPVRVIAVAVAGAPEGVGVGGGHGTDRRTRGAPPWRTWVTSPTVLASAWTPVLAESRRTFVHVWLGSSRQSQVPVGETLVLGRTAHQVLAWCQIFDWGFLADRTVP